MKRVALAVLLTTAALVGCGGDVDPATTPAGRAHVEYNEDLYNGRFAQAYADLHPAHKQLVSRTFFEDCAASTIAVGQLDSIEVLDVFNDPVQIAGNDVQAKAVRVRLSSTSGRTVTLVGHEVKIGDRWYWVLNDSAIQAYQASRCPGG